MTRPSPKPRSSDSYPGVAFALESRVALWGDMSPDQRDEMVDEAIASMLTRGYWQIPPLLVIGDDDLVGDEVCNRFLDGSGVGEILDKDRKTVLSYRLPVPDATVGEWRGWHASTIIRWNHFRPRMTTGVDVEIRDDLRVSVERYEKQHRTKLTTARWLLLREEAIARLR